MLRRVVGKPVMQQRIRFCSTEDGVRIAYATVGSGPALIFAQWISHLELEWEEPRIRDFWETIGRHHMVVRYDKHGCGLSDRNRTDFSLDSEIRPIEAIVKELGLESFVLWGQGGGAVPAIGYAVRFPDRVSHLVLSNPGTGILLGGILGGDVSPDTFRALMLSNSRIAQLAWAEGMLGNSFDAASLQWYLRYRQEAVTPEIHAQLLLTYRWHTDVRDLLPKVSVPTLVAHYRNNRMMAFEAGRETAAGIPGARFVPLEGNAHLFFFSDTRPLLRAIAEFLGDPPEEAERPSTDVAKVPSAPEAVQGIFSKEGEFWTIACRGEVFRLRDVRGLVYIAYLLGHPREEFHVLSLASKSGGKQGAVDELAEPASEEQATQSDLTVGRMGDAGEMLDAQAKAAYKRRTAELREQLEEARELNQLELVDRLEDEIEDVGRELSRAVGLGGRDRRAASAAERARINVTRAIKIALERIAEHNPALAALLTSSIRTGTFCSYTPDSRLPASWQL
jgi:pimeloyl-ACP methyl ester carboxylesterase